MVRIRSCNIISEFFGLRSNITPTPIDLQLMFLLACPMYFTFVPTPLVECVCKTLKTKFVHQWPMTFALSPLQGNFTNVSKQLA